MTSSYLSTRDHHPRELIGHLPIYGIMALLLVWIPGRRNLDEWMDGVSHPLAGARVPA